MREIYDLVAARRGVTALRVSTRKPDIYPDCAGVGVELVELLDGSAPRGAVARAGAEARPSPADNRPGSPAPRRRSASRRLAAAAARGRVQASRYQSKVSGAGGAAASSTISDSATDQRGCSPGRRSTISEIGRLSAVCRKIWVSLSPGSEPGTWKARPMPVIRGGASARARLRAGSRAAARPSPACRGAARRARPAAARPGRFGTRRASTQQFAAPPQLAPARPRESFGRSTR